MKTNKSCAFQSQNLCAQMQIETQIQIHLCILTCIILIHSSIQLQLQMYVYKITWKKLWLCKNSPGKQQFKIVQFQVLVQIQYKYRCKKVQIQVQIKSKLRNTFIKVDSLPGRRKFEIGGIQVPDQVKVQINSKYM